MAARPKDFSLIQAIAQPSFTPGGGDVVPLVGWLGGDDDDLMTLAERALLRMGRGALRPALQHLEEAGAPLRGRLCRLVGTLALGEAGEEGPGPARGALFHLLSDADDKTRRNAMLALGRLPDPPHPDVEQALIAAWHGTGRVDHRRTLAASLGKVGGQAALSLLRGLRTDDAELSRIAQKSVLMLERTFARSAPAGLSAIRLDRVLPLPLPLRLHCRAGVERLLLSECPSSYRPVSTAPGEVDVTLPGPPADLLRLRTMLHFGWRLPPVTVDEGGDVAAAIAGVLASAEALLCFRTFTEGLPRFRLSFAEGGHRRALVWRCAQAVAERTREIRNDPRESNWEVRVAERPGALSVELCPRHFPDERFAYRKRDVPAASHPTLAAALALVAGVRPDDVVWDPFTGSGLELCERALLGPYASLCGTDLDDRALAAARENLRVARIARVELVRTDALRFSPPGVTLIVTNPPMGRRVLRGEDLGGFLDAFVAHAGRVLVRGGRLVWISPLPQRTCREARRAGLLPGLLQDVDMGGFTAQIQVFRQRA